MQTSASFLTKGKKKKSIRFSAELPYQDLAMEMDCLWSNQCPRR